MTAFMLGELLFADDIIEVWVWQGLAVVTVNEVEEIFS